MSDTKNQVKESLRKGTGRALLLVRENQDIDFSDLIFDACINCQAYDPQCQENRAKYLYRIIASTKQSQILENKLVGELLNESIEDWDLCQLFSLCKIFALKGNVDARQNLYRRFDPTNCSREIHATDLIDLDGLEALAFIAEARGKCLQSDSSAWEDDHLITYTNESLSGTQALSFLQEKAINNNFIQAYLVAVNANQERLKERKSKDWSYDAFNQEIQAGHLSRFSAWHARLKQDDILKIAEDFLNEKDENIQQRYLKLFAGTKFPFEFDKLTKFVESNDESIRAHALKSLSFFKDGRIRQIALNNIESRVCLRESFEILSNNFEESDLDLIEKILLGINDDDEFHYLEFGTYKILEDDRNIEICKTDKLINLFKLIYSKEQCSFCREGTVELMIKYQLLPKEIAEEAIFDSNSDIGELVHRGGNPCAIE
ncbi:hypothetical protein [Tumidithrix helvetica]|uniref:hypothetical protein n=1 Tax=Tumidithrix helvetica TaxID=3457545 RepID=UPI003CC557BD